MQLSEDGQHMWNGTEWIPNPDAAVSAPAPAMVEAAPAQAIIAGNVASMSMPAVQPMGGMPAVATGGSMSADGLDFTRGFSTLKYGFAAFLSSIVTVVLVTIVWSILGYIVATSGSLDELAISMIIALIIGFMFTILAVTQVLTLVMGMGISDGLGKAGLGFVGSWKTAGVAILESAPVLGVASILLVVGFKIEGSVQSLSFVVSISMLILFQMGLLAFMARKVAEDL
jgi:hypothetical protein